MAYQNIVNLADASPVEIDTELARIHGDILRVTAQHAYIVDHVLSHAGLRHYRGNGRYDVTGTFRDGVARLNAYLETYAAWVASNYNEAFRVKPLSNFACTPDAEELARLVEEESDLTAKRYELWAEANQLEAEYRRRPWSRYHLVTSSAGHIHSSTHCQTCRITTEYGWLPDMSGQSEAEAMATLGPNAEALCTVCFPSAPVSGKATITKAKAAKLSAGAVAQP